MQKGKFLSSLTVYNITWNSTSVLLRSKHRQGILKNDIFQDKFSLIELTPRVYPLLRKTDIFYVFATVSFRDLDLR